MQPSRKPKVIAARSYTGVQVGAAVFNSLNMGKNGIETMELSPYGLHLTTKDKAYIVPYANIQSIEVEK